FWFLVLGFARARCRRSFARSTHNQKQKTKNPNLQSYVTGKAFLNRVICGGLPWFSQYTLTISKRIGGGEDGFSLLVSGFSSMDTGNTGSPARAGGACPERSRRARPGVEDPPVTWPGVEAGDSPAQSSSLDAARTGNARRTYSRAMAASSRCFSRSTAASGGFTSGVVRVLTSMKHRVSPSQPTRSISPRRRRERKLRATIVYPSRRR